MPTAQEYLQSDQPIVVVFSVLTDNTKLIDQTYNDWVGGKSMLSYDLGVDRVENDSQVYLTTGQVFGIEAHQVVSGEVYFERKISPPFEDGLTIDYGQIEVIFSADDLSLYQRDFYNRPFELWVGYEGGNWADFAKLYTGKTIGRELRGEVLKINLSINPIGTDRYFPINKYSDGRVKPYLFNEALKFKPVKVNANVDDGLWQFHDGVVATTDAEFDFAPLGYLNPSESSFIGSFSYFIRSDDIELITSVNSLPPDLTVVDGAFSDEGDYVKIVVPDSGDYLIPGGLGATLPYNATLTIRTQELTDLLNVKHTLKVSLALDSASTIDEYEIDLIISNSETQKVKISKNLTTVNTVFIEVGAGAPEFQVSISPVPADDAETIIINVYEMRIQASLILGQDVRAYNPSGGQFVNIPTFRVANAYTEKELPEGIVVYDDAGYLRVSPNNTGFVIDAIGDTTNNDLVSVCQYISTQANGTNSPITSSITSPEIGYFCNEEKRIIDHWRGLLSPVDCYLDVDNSGNNIDIKRRFNGNPKDTDGNDNELESFDFNDDDITSFEELSADNSFKTYNVRYRMKLSEPENSVTRTANNIFSRSNDTKEIRAPLIRGDDSQVIADLVSRDGNPRRYYRFSIDGVGSGLKPEMVGTLDHRKTKRGQTIIRSVKEYILAKKTVIEGVKNG